MAAFGVETGVPVREGQVQAVGTLTCPSSLHAAQKLGAVSCRVRESAMPMTGRVDVLLNVLAFPRPVAVVSATLPIIVSP